MLGTKLSYMDTYFGRNLWVSVALPFNHPATGETINTVYTADGSMIVSPERAADIRAESTKDIESGTRREILPVITPEKI